MKSSFTLLAGIALAGSLQLVSAADLTGKVTLKGTPPPEKVNPDIAADQFCGKLHAAPVMSRAYVVAADKGLGNVLVYIKAGAKAPYPAREATLIDQVGCLYEPYVSGVMANQAFKIRNSDGPGLLHNVHSLPKTNKEFNFGQAVKGQVNEKTFTDPELMITFKCDVHPWMYAYVSVVDNPYFAVTDKDGNFKIANLPPGKYTVEVVHKKAGTSSQEITFDGTKPLAFTLEVPPAQ